MTKAMDGIFTNEFKKALFRVEAYIRHRKPNAEQLQAFVESQFWVANEIKDIEVEHEDGHFYVVNIYLKNKHYISLYFPGEDEE